MRGRDKLLMRMFFIGLYGVLIIAGAFCLFWVGYGIKEGIPFLFDILSCFMGGVNECKKI